MLTKAQTARTLWHETGDPLFEDVEPSPYESTKPVLDSFDLKSLPSDTYDLRLLPDRGGDI